MSQLNSIDLDVVFVVVDRNGVQQILLGNGKSAVFFHTNPDVMQQLYAFQSFCKTILPGKYTLLRSHFIALSSEKRPNGQVWQWKRNSVKLCCISTVTRVHYVYADNCDSEKEILQSSAVYQR